MKRWIERSRQRRTQRWLQRWSAACVLPFVLAPIAAAEPPQHLLKKHASWRYFAEEDTPPENWNQRDFDASTWNSGKAGFGYGDGDDRTLIDMRYKFRSIYLRCTFEIENPEDVKGVHLYLNYDDGFIAYINGTQVAQSSVAKTRDGELRVSLHEGGRYEEFFISNFDHLLRRGANVIAIEGHNATSESSDFSLDPFLTIGSLRPQASLDDLRADLDEFADRVLDQSSYLTRTGFDFRAAVKRQRDLISEETEVPEFLSELHKLLMNLGDCHSSVRSNDWPKRQGSLPFRPADTEHGLAALSINQDSLLDPDAPYLHSIDGVEIDTWLAAASRFVASGSPQFIRQRSLGWMTDAKLVRDELGLTNREIVEIKLRSADHQHVATKRMRLTRQRVSVARLNFGRSRIVGGNIGYLRLPVMDEQVVDSAIDNIQAFRNTDGLVIDVRDNGGGTYEILMSIYGFFVAPDARPYITNIAAYRNSSRFDADHIQYRPTYPQDWAGWNDVERDVISETIRQFKPAWNLPKEKFSDWHFMILSRKRNDRRMTKRRDIEYYFYDRPVIVLCNAASFSATDGFLSAFADLPNVKLLGEPSGGGSGARRRFTLPHTNATVSISSMASFRPNGKLFDGNGIEVDIESRARLEDFTDNQDTVLDQAVRWQQAKSK